MSTKALEITLPKPYPLQREILAHSARHKLIVAGRRAGKTVLAGLMAAHYLLDGKQVLIASNTAPQANIFWDMLERWFAPLTAAGLVVRHRAHHTLRLGNGLLTVRTASEPDNLRGFSADLLILDECALLPASIWREVGIPILADRQGRALLISTPKRKNWFFELYIQALRDTSGTWKTWAFSTEENPHIARAEIEAMASNMSEISFKQEILAQFVDASGQVFRNIEQCTYEERYNTYEDYCKTYHDARMALGIDWGRSEDYTALVVGDIQNRKVVYVERFTQIPFEQQLARVVELVKAWHVEIVKAEYNSMGGPMVERLQSLLEGTSTQVYKFNTTSATKPRIIEQLSIAFERVQIQIPRYEEALLHELEFFSVLDTTSTNRYTYGAPKGVHDDYVIALCLWYDIVVNVNIRWVY
ncbi:MAG: hypothetical protein D6712_18805 [Chloroflexi bacterium]|nr:MAG: hypothetical protein D6712_18805 [Chloroflexota bacterium]